MKNTLKYLYDYNDHFYTIDKDYKILLSKSDNGVQISKKKNENTASNKEYRLDQSKLLSGRISVAGVENQLANIRQIVLEVTDACNLQCTYCAYGEFYEDYDKRVSQYMDPDKAKMLIDFIVDKASTSANLSHARELTISFYGGEPLMNMSFIQDIVAYTEAKKNRFITFKYSMTTNGLLLKKNMDFLLSHDFNSIMVSLDGSEKNNAYRKFLNGKPSFPIVYENLKYIQENHPEFFTKIILFNAVVHDLNNITEIARFIHQKFNKIPLFSSVNDSGVKPGLKDAFKALAQAKKENNIIDPEFNMESILGL